MGIATLPIVRVLLTLPVHLWFDFRASFSLGFSGASSDGSAFPVAARLFLARELLVRYGVGVPVDRGDG